MLAFSCNPLRLRRGERVTHSCSLCSAGVGPQHLVHALRERKRRLVLRPRFHHNPRDASLSLTPLPTTLF